MKTTISYKQILEDFETLKWDCDICPLSKTCKFKGTMLLEDCADDCIEYWTNNNIRPAFGIMMAATLRD